MKKVWQTKRNGIPGIYVEWYDFIGKRRSKYFHPKHKVFVRPFMTRKFAELNSDCCMPGAVLPVIWQDFIKEYMSLKKMSLACTSLSEINHTCQIFAEICTPYDTSQITQQMINDFITERKEQVKPHTVNKDVRNLRALLHWGKKKNYIHQDIIIPTIKTEAKLIRVLTDEEIQELLLACGNDLQWRMRILLALCTGLRRSDIDRLELKHIDIDRKTISVINKKTGKPTQFQPLPDALIPEIIKFIDTEIETGQTKFFKTAFTKKWYSIKKKSWPGRH